MSKQKRLTKKARGQGMTEYIIIVALIAIAAIGVITVFGDNIKGLFGISANALAGETDVKTADHTKASKTDYERKKISNFGQNNGGAY